MAVDYSKQKYEVWVFRKIGERLGKPIYERVGYNHVYFGDCPEGHVEPVSDVQYSYINNSGQTDLLNRAEISANEHPQVIGFEFVNESGPWHEVNKFDGK